MADIRDSNVFDGMPSGNPGINVGTSGSLHEINWGTESWSGASDAVRDAWDRVRGRR